MLPIYEMYDVYTNANYITTQILEIGDENGVIQLESVYGQIKFR